MSNQTVETVGTAANRIKLTLAVLVVAAGIVGYSMLEGQNAVARVGVFIASLLVALGIVWFSDTGRRTVGYLRDSMTELRRVVWPSRQEATRMTGVVFVFVAIMALILWLFDKILAWVIYGLFLGWN